MANDSACLAGVVSFLGNRRDTEDSHPHHAFAYFCASGPCSFF